MPSKKNNAQFRERTFKTKRVVLKRIYRRGLICNDGRKKRILKIKKVFERVNINYHINYKYYKSE